MIKASTYIHDPKPKVECRDNFDSWPLNIEMETEFPINTNKTQKRIDGTSGTTDMEEGHVHKKERSQGTKEEQE